MQFQTAFVVFHSHRIGSIAGLADQPVQQLSDRHNIPALGTLHKRGNDRAQVVFGPRFENQRPKPTTRRAYGFPGPPALPLAKRPWAPRFPFPPFVDGCSIITPRFTHREIA